MGCYVTYLNTNYCQQTAGVCLMISLLSEDYFHCREMKNHKHLLTLSSIGKCYILTFNVFKERYFYLCVVFCTLRGHAVV
jgi:hypothetical protein